MKKKVIILSTVGIALILGAIALMPGQPSAEMTVQLPAAEPNVPAVVSLPPMIKTNAVPAVVPEPEKTAPPVIVATPEPAPEKPATPTLSAEEKRRIAIDRYYDHMERQFAQQLSQLNRETDPARRARLIATLGRYVRIDTLEALDWAATMDDPVEKRAALEAINKNALTGIGARIEMDDYGLPKIKETTILSAAESTGMVQPGDYIAGMVTADGTTVLFRGMDMREIVNYLRGQPGSQIQLRMERSPEYGSTQPIPFEVPLQRSLIVMQRPTDY